MKKIAKFEKVSFDQYKADCKDLHGNLEEYDDIKLPKRATTGSAGYDFYLPYDLTIKAKDFVLVPTGIRSKIDEDYVLQLYPRSSLGFKYGLQLRNTVGIIDSDYYNAKNEGHIQAKIINTSDEDVSLEKGSAFMQGIFMAYGITVDDETDGLRSGGFGSTNKENK